MPQQRFSKADKPFGLGLGGLENRIEGSGQLRDHGIAEEKADVTPALSHTVPLIFGRQVKSPNQGQGVVHDQKFAVVPNRDVAESDPVKPTAFSARRAERVEKSVRQIDRTKAID